MNQTDVIDTKADEKRAFFAAAIIIVVGVIATTLAQTVILAWIPLQNLLKNTLNLDAAGTAAFFFWVVMPWNVKPIIGMLQDTVPVFGTRRKSYLMIGGTLGAIIWFAMTLTPVRYGPLLFECILISVAMVIASTAIGGYMVEAAKGSASSGRMTSFRNFAEQFSTLVAGPVGGFLGTLAIGWTALCCGSVAFLIVPIAWFMLRERPHARTSGKFGDVVMRQFVAIGNARAMWAAAGLAALFYIAPGIVTALFYKQQNELHMTTVMQGNLQFLNGAFGVLAAFFYGVVLCKRFKLRTLLMITITLGAIGNMAYLFYNTSTQVYIAESVYGFGFTMAEIGLMHMCVRATPSGCEALGFSLLMSVRNFCLYGSNWLGSYFVSHLHMKFNDLVLFNGGTSLLAVPLVLLLPKAITMIRDGVQEPDPGVDLTQVPSHATHG